MFGCVSSPAGLLGGESAARAANVSPYPPSKVILGIEWASAETIIRQAPGGDNWPMTWADDGHLYTAYGDGFGFEPLLPEKLGMGFARVERGPEDFAGYNIRSDSLENRGQGGRRQEGQRHPDGRWRAVPARAQRRQLPARLVPGLRPELDLERVDVHHQFRLPDVPQLRPKLCRGARRIHLYLLARP